MGSKRLVFLSFVLSLSSTAWCLTPEEIARSLLVTFSVEGNYAPAPSRYTSQIVLHNIGSAPIPNGDWSIYYCNPKMQEPDGLIPDPGTTPVPNPEGTELGSTGFTLYHVTGSLFKLKPNNAFQNILPGEQKVLTVVGEFWLITRTDVFPNFYVANDAGEFATIPNTADEDINFVTAFTQPEQYKRMSYDLYAPYTAQQRYDHYVADDLGSAPHRVVPRPISSTLWADPSKFITIDSSWVIVDGLSGGGSEDSSEASYLAEKLDLEIVDTAPANNFIELKLDPNYETVESCQGNVERYSLVAADENILLVAPERSGVFFAIQTLMASISKERKLGLGEVDDCPRFPFRSFMADVGRHFLPTAEVLRLLEAMSLYKLNKFHFHLTDDEGFRVEIPDLEELTTVGATRCHDPTGDNCIMPQLGSPPSKDSPGSGFYSVEEYQTILRYANSLHIEVIPEVDMPGHAHAMINAMASRNRTTGDDTYILIDPDDPTKYLSVQYFPDNAMNPCINSTYKFVEVIIDTFVELHKDIQPLNIFHWGGDEVPGAWEESPACKELAQNEPSLPDNPTMKQLKGYFVRRVESITKARGLKASAWEDGLIGDDGLPIEVTEETYVNAWSNVWEWGAGKRAYDFANADGYKSIISHATHFYFDHPTEPDPEERGYYWATRFTDTLKSFSYVASDIYKNIDIDRFGHKLNKTAICANGGCPPLEKPENIVGIQGHLWSETIRLPQYFHSNVFPRLLALAERAWHKASWEDLEDDAERAAETQKDFNEFANRLGYVELRRLDNLGIKYNAQPPAVLKNEEELSVKTEFPGLGVEYSTDWGATWQQYYPGMPAPSTDAIFVTKSADGTRSSRSVSVPAQWTRKVQHRRRS